MDKIRLTSLGTATLVLPKISSRDRSPKPTAKGQFGGFELRPGQTKELEVASTLSYLSDATVSRLISEGLLRVDPSVDDFVDEAIIVCPGCGCVNGAPMDTCSVCGGKGKVTTRQLNQYLADLESERIANALLSQPRQVVKRELLLPWLSEAGNLEVGKSVAPTTTPAPKTETKILGIPRPKSLH
jgi:hypothetical protein